MHKIFSLLFLLVMASPLYAQRFVDVTEQAGLDTIYTITRAADVYNTGFEDLFTFSGQPIFGQTSQLQFLHNTGTGVFQNIIATSGLDMSDTLIGIRPFTGMQFYDLDKDGHRDAILGARRDNGSYVIVWGSMEGFSMMDTTSLDSALNDGFGQSHRLTVLDLDRDGWFDLQFSQAAPAHPPRPNPIRYFRNNGNRTFTEIFNPIFPPSVECNMNSPLGIALDKVSDYNSDGIQDFAGFSGWGWRKYRFGRGTGIPPPQFPTRPCWDADTLGFEASVDSINATLDMFHDFNNDGYVDFLFSPSLLFISEPQPNRKVRYHNIMPDSFLTSTETLMTGGAFDFNGDGSLDMVRFIERSPFFTKTMLWQNLLPSGDGQHNFLKVRLEGVVSTREAIGANVIIVNSDTTGGKWWRQIRIVHPIRQNLHFGLGSTAVVDSLYINWPSGRRDLLRNISANQTLTIREGSSPLSVGTSNASPVQSFYLAQNYPNPFNPTTTIRYELPVASDVKLEVFDVLGRKVATLVSGRQSAGVQFIAFNAGGLASGIYFYKIQVGGFSQTKKMMLVK